MDKNKTKQKKAHKYQELNAVPFLDYIENYRHDCTKYL